MSGGGVPAAGCSYQKFVRFAMDQTRLRTSLVPHHSQVLFIPSRYAPATRVKLQY
jgi:phytochromobilin:ferredoxin oxidoreductase